MVVVVVVVAVAVAVVVAAGEDYSYIQKALGLKSEKKGFFI